MTRQSFCIFLLVVFPYPAVFCWYDYFQHIHGHSHKGHSTKDVISSTTIAITPEETYSSKQAEATHGEISPEKPDDASSEDISSSEDIQNRRNEKDHKEHKEKETVLQKGDPYRDEIQYKFVARIGIIVGSIVIIVTCLGCIICCCPSCCRGKDRRGFIMRNAAEGREVEACPQHIVPPGQQPVIVQHFPPQYAQDTVQQFPPQYQQLPVHPQSQYPPPTQPFSQYSPVQPTAQPPPSHFSPGYQYSHTNPQFYNPPEAPPPYEAPTAPSN